MIVYEIQVVTVDLFSDTTTRPTPEMRAFMAQAEVGDEQLGEDPTVNLLQDMAAELLGKQAAVFVPSGTMCNEISFAVHCRPGDAILMDSTAHGLNFESGGPAAIAGALVSPLNGRRGVFSGEQVSAAIRPAKPYFPRARLVTVEQTSNVAGGVCWPLETMREVCNVAHDHGLAAHLDGARLLNAVVATGVAAAEYASTFDSAWIDLTKGLGAPVGAVLCGSGGFIEEARRVKQRLGGAMRQAGVIAAAGVYALRHNVDRLAEDHANAAELARGLAALPGIDLDPAAVDTNIVIFDIAATGFEVNEFIGRMIDEHGVRFSPIGRTTVRAVTHLDVSAGDVAIAVAGVRDLLSFRA